SREEKARRMALLRQGIHYSRMLVFQLVDAPRRIFQTQRYCFLGSVDDWIEIGKPGKLPALVKKYVKHLGQDSVVSLHTADKYHRLTRRLSQDQKGLEGKA